MALSEVRSDRDNSLFRYCMVNSKRGGVVAHSTIPSSPHPPARYSFSLHGPSTISWPPTANSGPPAGPDCSAARRKARCACDALPGIAAVTKQLVTACTQTPLTGTVEGIIATKQAGWSFYRTLLSHYLLSWRPGSSARAFWAAHGCSKMLDQTATSAFEGVGDGPGGMLGSVASVAASRVLLSLKFLERGCG